MRERHFVETNSREVNLTMSNNKSLPATHMEIPSWLYAPYTKQREIAEMILLKGINDVSIICKNLGVSRQTVWNVRSKIRRLKAEMASIHKVVRQVSQGVQGGQVGPQVAGVSGVSYSKSSGAGISISTTYPASSAPFTTLHLIHLLHQLNRSQDSLFLFPREWYPRCFGFK